MLLGTMPGEEVRRVGCANRGIDNWNRNPASTASKGDPGPVRTDLRCLNCDAPSAPARPRGHDVPTVEGGSIQPDGKRQDYVVVARWSIFDQR